MKKVFILVIAIIVIAVASQAQNTWIQKADFGGTGRYGAVGFSIGSKGYLGTGYDWSSFKKDFWEYDPEANSWTQKADFGGTARYYAVGFSIDSKGYLGTGIDQNIGATKDFWEYDPDANTWIPKTDFAGTVREGAVGFSIGNKGYLGTGRDCCSYYKDFWEYDTDANVWTQKADFGGEAREYAVGFKIGNKGYLGTGWSYDNTNFNEHKDFWEYDPEANTWIQKADFSGDTRIEAVGFSIGSKGYVGMGVTLESGLNYKDFWQYEPQTNMWTEKADYGGESAANRSVGFSIDDSKGYIGTGSGKDFWEYTPDAPTTLTTGTVKLHACPGSDIEVPFIASGFNSGNIFTAQLSDANENFTSAVDIGTLSGTSSGTIAATIPISTSGSPHYRIRVVASDPVTIGTDNGSDIGIKCFTPVDLTVNQVAATKAKLSWKNTHCDVSYTFALQQVGTNYWNTLTTTYHYMTLFGLHPSTEYVFKVRTNCSDAVQSPWSSTESFTTGSLREGVIGDDEDGSLNLYPDPTSGTFTLDLKLSSEVASDAEVQLMNLLGQIIYEKRLLVVNGELQQEIQLDDAAAGMYLVKVIINDQVFTSQINFQK